MCEQGISAEIFSKYSGVMLGEVHGSSEALAFVGHVTCNLAANHRPVVLALEYPRDEQLSIDAFLHDSNPISAEANLLRTPFWKQSPNDGRASEAFLKLLHHIRLWREARLSISVIAYDVSAELGQNMDSASRERSNAKFLSKILRTRTSQDFLVIHSGNVHARKTKGLPGDRAFEPLGYYLRRWKLLHLDMAASGGTAWFCESPDPSPATDICGIHSLSTAAAQSVEPFSINLDSTYSPAFDGVYYLGWVSASPPARAAELAPDFVPIPDVQSP